MKRILIVEDEISKALEMKTKLEENGFAVDFALNVAEAMRLSIINTYVLIISDVVMPVINGIEFSSALKQQGINAPVLILTTRGARDAKADRLSPDQYLLKPFEFTDLLARVNTLID